MKITFDGKAIELEDSDTVNGMSNLVCESCGHRLADHSFIHRFGSFRFWYTSQCIACGLTPDHKFGCEQFRYTK